MTKKPTFAEAFAELETITEWFETGDIDLDEGLKSSSAVWSWRSCAKLSSRRLR